MLIVEGFDAFEDDRGSIRDLLRDEKIDSVTFIHCRPGAVRGNHWHEETTQWTILLSGKLLVFTRAADDEFACMGVLMPGVLMESPPGERHAWRALKDTEALVLTRGPRSGENYESDTFRLESTDRLI